MNENAFKAIVTKRAKIQSTQNCTFWHCCCSWWGGTGSQSCTRGRQDFERHVKLRMNRATLDAILANYLIYLSYLYSFHIINEFSKKYYKKSWVFNEKRKLLKNCQKNPKRSETCSRHKLL